MPASADPEGINQMNSVAQASLLDNEIDAALAAAEKRFVEANPASAQRQQAAKH